MRKTDRLLFQSTKEALLWLMRNYEHKMVLLPTLPGLAQLRSNMEKPQGKFSVLVGVKTIENLLRVWFYCLNVIRGNHIQYI